MALFEKMFRFQKLCNKFTILYSYSKQSSIRLDGTQIKFLQKIKGFKIVWPIFKKWAC